MNPTSTTTPTSVPAAPTQVRSSQRPAVVRTESGSTYRLYDDRLVLEGPSGGAFQTFTLISMDGPRLMYTDGEKLFRSSEIVSVAVV